MPGSPHPLAPVFQVLETLPTGRPIAAFAMARRVRVLFGWGPVDTGGWASNPWGTWLVLPKDFRDPLVLARLENVLLVAHELVHVLQRVARGNRLPFPLYREVEAHIAREVLAWEAAPLAPDPERARWHAAQALASLTADLPSGYAYVLSLGEGMWPLNYYRTPLFSHQPEGDNPLLTLADLLGLADLPVRVEEMRGVR
ncbi:MAG: hypothetical protein ACP5UM_10210 [Anaerolineae bacterium]